MIQKFDSQEQQQLILEIDSRMTTYRSGTSTNTVQVLDPETSRKTESPEVNRGVQPRAPWLGFVTGTWREVRSRLPDP